MIEIHNHIIQEDISNIIDVLKITLAKNGIQRFNKTLVTRDNTMVCCPFHNDGQERKPSFGILNTTKGKSKAGTCHCFTCGWTGSFEEMVSNCFGYNDMGVYGAKWLVSNFLTLSVETREELELDFNRKTIKSDKVKFVSEDELDKYRVYHPYMWKRKLTPEVVELFDIGYDEDTSCITFPVRDINGNTLFIARRSVNTKFFNYPESAEKPVYGLYEYSKAMQKINTQTYSVGGWKDCLLGSEIIICESMIDALTCWVYGKYAVALNGLGNDLQFKQLNNMACRKFILATDMDDAGKRARSRLKSMLKNKIVTEYIWDVNIAKDINDMTKEQFDNLREIM